MKTNILNIAGVAVLSKENLKAITGQGSVDLDTSIDLSLCGCSCSGAVTGPKYCIYYIACPQVYTCDQSPI
ncbi:MAG: hypothetical protein JNM71_14610 [Flavobacterium lindanitolerans]|jgi:hypothetical protein|uniref:hypothetical protein n=1 Tax=Flavobacterium TaxID=237 RepID=UPI0006FAD6F4|nr:MULTISPECIES: hypothetical protein [Flavobacterium]KQS53576.1 hypothetical protein ASG38_02270 [Flavobacterium sp. Leaf359]MBL7869246.1 hypothetical protein [Flavobacterium lindanitolerans]MBU7571618.1 hypothetical protein [Flavobacterium sp.]